MAAGPLGDLPGLTYDPVKNRYFPTREEDVKPKEEPRRGLKQRLERRGTADVGNGERKSKGKKERRRKEVVVEDEPERKEKCPRIGRTLLRATRLQLGYDRFSGPTSAEAQRRMRRERASAYARMTSITADDEPTFPSTLTVITTIPDQPSSILLGDAMGSIHAVKMEYDIPDWEMGERSHEAGEREAPRYKRWLWQEINLGKRITGIHATREHYIATTFGPRPRLIVSKLPLMLAAFVPDQPPFPFEEEEKSTVIWELTKMQDVWSMDCAENSVIVGGSQQIVYAADVINPEFRTIPTPGKSDALSVCQLNINEALVGLRNSAILHYDFRIPDKSSVVSRLELGKSVCGIKALEEGRGGGRSLIASGYTHQLALFDLRFPKTGPVRRYQDHVNDYRSGLGLTVDPSQTHVFAAGSDQKIRAWSIWDGQPVQEYGKPGPQRLLGQQHPAQISGIEMPEEDKVHVLNDRQLETYMQY